MNENMNGLNGHFETPFADVFVREADQYLNGTETQFENIVFEIDSPFSRTYELAESIVVNPAREEYINLLSELNDTEFPETLYDLANELEDTWKEKISNELALGSNYIPFVTRQANEYFEPLLRETSGMIDRISQHYSGNNLADHSYSDFENFFGRLEFDHRSFSPVQEQFFGKVFNKVKSVVKKGIDLAKKGASAIGKMMPLNLVLNKLKGLVKPLLEKVLKFAIGKLPEKLRPYAQTLAKKFLKLETESFQDAEDTAAEIEAIQTELDNNIAQLMFSSGELETDHTLTEYEFSFENIERVNSYGNDTYSKTQSYDAAKEKFIQELKSLQPGDSPAPAIEQFLPAAIIALQPAIKIALTIIGRKKVINFLGGSAC